MTIIDEEHRYDYRNLAVLSQRQSYLANTWITIARNSVWKVCATFVSLIFGVTPINVRHVLRSIWWILNNIFLGSG